MLSDKNNISLSNYEEYFILYMDNELTPDDKAMVDAFVLQHPQLADELELLLSTKLPVDDTAFLNKEELLSPYMKATMVDEALLLYVDNELSVEEKRAVDQKISANEDYAFQLAWLMQTKVDRAEKILYPNKKELYRHGERVRYIPVWMRIAAAIIIILLGSVFFIINSNRNPVADPQVVLTTPGQTYPAKQNKITELTNKLLQQPKNRATLLVKAPLIKKTNTVLKKSIVPVTTTHEHDDNIAVNTSNAPVKKNEVIRFDASHFTTQPTINDIALNKTITPDVVTSPSTVSYHHQNDPTEQDPSGGDFKPEKKTRGKGFFRKVSRFIERNTGIGTVNADNELLVGAVALKLK